MSENTLPTLHEIADSIAALEGMLDELDEGEESTREAILNTIEGAELDLEQKVENIIGLSRNWEMISTAAKAESERLSKIHKTYVAKTARLMGYLQAYLTKIERKQVRTKLGMTSFRKGSERTEITNADRVVELFPSGLDAKEMYWHYPDVSPQIHKEPLKLVWKIKGVYDALKEQGSDNPAEGIIEAMLEKEMISEGQVPHVKLLIDIVAKEEDLGFVVQRGPESMSIR